MSAKEDGAWRQKNDQQVVLYNENQKRVILQSDDEHKIISPRVIQNICSLCKRPLGDSTTFMDHGYFQYLDKTFKDSSPSIDLPSLHHIPRGAFNQGYYARFFREGRRLGHGARGSVYLVQHYLEDEMLGEYAAKKVPVGDDTEWLQRMLREVHIMESLRHANIIGYKHTWLEIHRVTQFGPAVPCLFILMEFANAGNLEDYVTAEVIDVDRPKNAGPSTSQLLPIEEILSLFLGIAEGLDHLHRFGIIHRDLKPSNILLNYPADQITMPNVMISDFGECNMADEKTRQKMDRTGATGTIEFCAPELFKMDKGGKRYLVEHSSMTDVWSLGMILYYLLFGGRLPFENIDDIEKLKSDLLSLRMVQVPSTRSDIPPSLLALLHSLLDLDAEERPSAAQTVRTVNSILKDVKSRKKTAPILKPALQLYGTVAPSLPKITPQSYRKGLILSFWLVLLAICYPKSISWKALFVLPLVASKQNPFLILAVQISCSVIIYMVTGSICAC